MTIISEGFFRNVNCNFVVSVLRKSFPNPLQDKRGTETYNCIDITDTVLIGWGYCNTLKARIGSQEECDEKDWKTWTVVDWEVAWNWK